MNATRERTAYRYEVHRNITDRLLDLRLVLMFKHLVGAYVVCAPRIVRCFRWLLSGAGRTRYCVDHNIAGEHSLLCYWQKSKLNGRCKATGIGYTEGGAKSVPVDFGKTVHERWVLCFKSEVVPEIDHLGIGVQRILLHPGSGLAVSKTQDIEVGIGRWKCIEVQIHGSVEIWMRCCHMLSGMRRAHGNEILYTYLTVMKQQTEHFAPCISCCTNNSYAYH